MGIGFTVGWWGVRFFEPASNAISRASNFWWFAEVSGTTIGYGDFYPTTTGGRICVSFMQLCIIIAFTRIFGLVIDRAGDRRARRLKGLFHLSMKEHVVIIGLSEILHELVQEMKAQGIDNIMVVAQDGAIDPFEGHELTHPVFRTAPVLNGATMIRNSCLADASSVVINTGDDGEALAIALAIRSHLPRLHVVVGLQRMRNQTNFANVPGERSVACVDGESHKLLAAEVCMPGASGWLDDLADAADGGMKMTIVPPYSGPLSVGDLARCLTALNAWYMGFITPDGRRFKAPHRGVSAGPGCSLVYTSEHTLHVNELILLWNN
jgi:voltage-gated potassium channel